MTILVDTPVYHPLVNVCIERLLPLHALDWGEPVARLWVDPPAVVVGRSTPLEENVDLALAGSMGIPIIRRNTGGGAVFHDFGNVNISVVVPTRDRVSPLEVYRVGTRVILEALKRLGLNGWVENHSDVVVDGWKVSGGAAFVSMRYYLFHATLLVKTDHVLVSMITPPRLDLVRKGVYSPAKYRPRSLASMVDGLSMSEALEAVVYGLEEVFGPIRTVGWEDGRGCPAEAWMGVPHFFIREHR